MSILSAAIGIAVILISVSKSFFDFEFDDLISSSRFLFSAGKPINADHHNLETEPSETTHNVETDLETHTLSTTKASETEPSDVVVTPSATETALVPTPSATSTALLVTESTTLVVTQSATKASSTDTISLYSSVMEGMIPLQYFTSHKPCRLLSHLVSDPLPVVAHTHSLSTFKITPMQSFFSHNPSILLSNLVSNPKPEISFIAYTHTPHSLITRPLSVTLTASNHPWNKPVITYPKCRILKPKKPPTNNYSVAEKNKTKSKFLTSRKPPTTCAPKPTASVLLSDPPTVDYTQITRPVFLSASNNVTKSWNKPVITYPKSRILKPKKPPMNKYSAAERIKTKPKMLTSKKPPTTCAPKPTASVLVSEPPTVDVTQITHSRPVFVSASNNVTKSWDKPVITYPKSRNLTPRKLSISSKPDAIVSHSTRTTVNNSKPKVFTSRKPSITCAPKPKPTAVVSHVIQINRMKCFIADGTNNETTTAIKPTAARSLSTHTTHIKVNPKGCIQRWRF